MDRSLQPLYRYSFENAEFDERRMELRVDGAVRAIEPRPLELLAELIRHAGEAVSKEELVELLWDGRPSAPNVLANAVKKLRDALGSSAAGRIVTLARVGYRFDGPVAREAVGRRDVAGPLALEAGMAVPGRGDGCRLTQRLGQSSRHQVWRAWNAGLKVHRVFKFASDGPQLAALKRELTLSSFLQGSLGPREDLAVVLDANFSTEPYFLEFQDLGVDLLDWASTDGQLAALGTPERLALFLQVARTVNDAHALGVLHKDIKPSNIIVRAEGAGLHTTLVDFGSGRLLEREKLQQLGLTAQGMTVTNVIADSGAEGTYLYLAPELLQGQAPTVRSDLFALGVLLFQLLCGDMRRPLATGWHRLIDDELLVADITAATEGAPQDRLASVAELIARVSRLEQRRAQARDQAAAQAQAQRTAAALERARTRRPWVVAAIGSLVVGLCGVLWFYWQSVQALEVSRTQAARAESIVDFLTNDVFQAADPTRSAAAGGQVPRTARDVLVRAAETAGQRFAGHPQTEAQIHTHLARAFTRQMQFDQAEEAYRRAEKLYTGAAPRGDPRLLRVLLDHATMLTDRGRLDEAQALIDRAGGEASPALLETNLELQAELQRALAALNHRRGDFAQALKHAQQDLAVRKRLPSASVGDRHRALMQVIHLMTRTGQNEAADRLYAEAEAPPYDAQGIGQYRVSYTRLKHAYLAFEMGDVDKAEARLADAVKAYEPIDGTMRGYEFHLKMMRGFLHEFRGQLPQAAQAFAAAHEFGVRHAADGVANAGHANLKSLFARVYSGDSAQVAGELQRLHDATRQAKPDAGALPAQVAFHLARSLTDTGRPAQALKLLEALKDSDLQQEDPAYEWAGRLMAEQARAMHAVGRAEAAAALMRQAQERMRAGKVPKWVAALYAGP